MSKASDNIFPKVIESMNTTDQAAPSDASWKIYAKAGGIYARSSNSIVGPFGTSAGTALTAAVSVQTAGGDYTTTSATYADIDGTNLSLTMTTGAHRVKVTLTCLMKHTSTSNAGNIDVLVDGSGLGGNGVWMYRPVRNSENFTVSYTWVSSALTAASHTVKLQWKTDGGTLTMFRASAQLPIVFLIEELPI